MAAGLPFAYMRRMAHVPVGTAYTSTIEAALLVDFVCKRCGHAAVARVRSKGEGQATAYAFIGGARAKARATGVAAADLKANAAAVVSLAKCPACSFVDQEAASAARTVAFLKSAAVVAVATLMAVLLPERSATMVWAMPLIGVVAAFVQYQKASWRWSEVDERVEFVKGAKKKRSRGGERASALRLGFAWGETVAEVPLSWPFAQGLRLGLLRLDAGGPCWLEAADLDESSEEDARQRALANLQKAGKSGLLEVEPGVYRGRWNDQLAASRLAAPALFRELRLSGAAVAFTSSEDTLFVAGSEDRPGLERAFALSRQDLPRVLDDDASPAGRFTAHPWVLTGAGWQPWAVPEDHPLRPAIAALDAMLGERGWRPG